MSGYSGAGGSNESSGAVAQLGERLICIQEVVGSIPISSTSLTEFNESRHALVHVVRVRRGCIAGV